MQFIVVIDEGCAQLEKRAAHLWTTCVFRRSGEFRSSPNKAADELHAFLIERGIVGRAIYVAPSFAAFTALCEAHRYPGDFAGIVLVDPSHPRQGLYGLKALSSMPASPLVDRLRGFFAGFGPVWDAACREVSEIESLGELPIAILVAGRFELLEGLPKEIIDRMIRDRLALMSEYCGLTTNGTLIMVEPSGHDIATGAPESVIAAIQTLIKNVNSQSETTR